MTERFISPIDIYSYSVQKWGILFSKRRSDYYFFWG
jgi:hypothetical protein